MLAADHDERLHGMWVWRMDAPQAVLHWDRGALEAECDRAAIVQAGVEAYLGRAVFSPDGRVIVRVKLSREQHGAGQHVVASVVQESEDGRIWGERRVSGEESCASLDDPLTLVVALLVDSPGHEPESAANEPPPPEGQQRAPRPLQEPPAETAASHDTGEIQTAPSLERSTTAPGHAALFGLGLASMGGLPSVGVGGGVLATFKPRGFWAVGVHAGALVPQSKPLGSGSLEASLVLLAGDVCPLQGFEGGTWWSACGSMGVARLHIESQDLLESKSRSEWIPLPGFSARAAWSPGSGLLLGGGLEALFPVSPDRYVYRDPEGSRQIALEASPLLIAASLGIGLLIE